MSGWVATESWEELGPRGSNSERRLANEAILEEEVFLVIRRIVRGERLDNMFETLYVELTVRFAGGEEAIEAGLQVRERLGRLSSS